MRHSTILSSGFCAAESVAEWSVAVMNGDKQKVQKLPQEGAATALQTTRMIETYVVG